jgi:hypothetical protein
MTAMMTTGFPNLYGGARRGAGSSGAMSLHVCPGSTSPVNKEVLRRLKRNLDEDFPSFRVTQYTFHSIWNGAAPTEKIIGQSPMKKRMVEYQVRQGPYQHPPQPALDSESSIGAIVDAIMEWEEEDKQCAAEGLVLLKTQIH